MVLLGRWLLVLLTLYEIAKIDKTGQIDTNICTGPITVANKTRGGGGTTRINEIYIFDKVTKASDLHDQLEQRTRKLFI